MKRLINVNYFVSKSNLNKSIIQHFCFICNFSKKSLLIWDGMCFILQKGGNKNIDISIQNQANLV